MTRERRPEGRHPDLDRRHNDQPQSSAHRAKATGEQLEATIEAERRVEAVTSTLAHMAMTAQGEAAEILDGLTRVADDAVYFLAVAQSGSPD